MTGVEQGKRSGKAAAPRIIGSDATPASPRGRRKAKAMPADVSPEQRYTMIAHAAYMRAAARGFAPGGELDDWLAAEAEIDVRLGSR